MKRKTVTQATLPALFGVTLSACSPDPVEVVKEARTLCPSDKPFAAIVQANVANPSYGVSFDQGERQKVAIKGTVAYIGEPVTLEVAVDAGTPQWFMVRSDRLSPERLPELQRTVCAGSLPVDPEFGIKPIIAQRVARARQAEEPIARMMRIEGVTPQSSAEAGIGEDEPFKVIEDATIMIPLSDIIRGMDVPAIYMVPREATKGVYFSCMTNLPYELYPLLDEDCQNPVL